MTTIISIPPITKSMALGAAAGSNRVWQGEWRRSDFASPYAWANSLRWAAKDKQDRWTAMYLLASIAPGPTPTITGHVANVEQALGMWSGCSLCPSFDSQAECEAWMDEQGLHRAECLSDEAKDRMKAAINQAAPKGWESVEA